MEMHLNPSLDILFIPKKTEHSLCLVIPRAEEQRQWDLSTHNVLLQADAW